MKYPENYPTSPEALWRRFYELTQVPRPSKKEEKVRKYLVEAAKERGLEYKTDQIGNVVIYVPATEGYESNEPVILQSHMDMVCDKLPEKKFDFENDPLDIVVKNGWVHADGTTLGADNGFGCAAMLATMDDKTLKHPKLELLFTVDEETGLNGALNLDPKMLSGKKLINIDTEEWGAVYIGCAGGIDYKLNRKYAMVNAKSDHSTVRIDISELKGGHSGMDIHQGRGNAIKLLAQLLWKLRDLNLSLVEFCGGKAHNIIPRDAYAVINIPTTQVDKAKEICLAHQEIYRGILPKEDREVLVECATIDTPLSKNYSEVDMADFLRMVTIFPHGAHSFNWEGDDPIVNYSNNLAIVKLVGESLYVESSLRFFDRREAFELENRIESICESYGLDGVKHGEYPSWKPDFNNALLEVAKDTYKDTFGGELKVKAIHAGLECGILKDRLWEMDAISIGPNLLGVHSPTEGLEIDSSVEFWKLFSALLARL